MASNNFILLRIRHYTDHDICGPDVCIFPNSLFFPLFSFNKVTDDWCWPRTRRLTIHFYHRCLSEKNIVFAFRSLHSRETWKLPTNSKIRRLCFVLFLINFGIRGQQLRGIINDTSQTVNSAESLTAHTHPGQILSPSSPAAITNLFNHGWLWIIRTPAVGVIVLLPWCAP